MSSEDKLAFLLEAMLGPLWKGKSIPLLKRLELLYATTDKGELKNLKNLYFRFLRMGAKRNSKALRDLCTAIERQFGIKVLPEWIVDPQLSPIEFAAKLGYDEIQYDTAMQDLKLNQAFHEPERLSDMNTDDWMREGIWLVERYTNDARTTRRSTCILVITEQMLEYRRDGHRCCHFAYLFAPYGGRGTNRSTRPRVTKYVGRGAVVAGSLIFNFNSEGRVPSDEAYMWIVASDADQSRYTGGYVSKNIDKNNLPGVRWIDISYMSPKVTVESINELCELHVKSADELAGEQPAKPAVPPRAPPERPITPKDVLKKSDAPRPDRVPRAAQKGQRKNRPKPKGL